MLPHCYPELLIRNFCARERDLKVDGTENAVFIPAQDDVRPIIIHPIQNDGPEEGLRAISEPLDFLVQK
jgi:hypothetical protein